MYREGTQRIFFTQVVTRDTLKWTINMDLHGNRNAPFLTTYNWFTENTLTSGEKQGPGLQATSTFHLDL